MYMQLSALETAQSSKNKQTMSSVATKTYDLHFCQLMIKEANRVFSYQIHKKVKRY